MVTHHRILIESSEKMSALGDGAVDLVVTSPPYPMIKMWDEPFGRDDPSIAEALERGDGKSAFSSMHSQLDLVWAECFRVLRPGGFMCVNIGDAVRTVGEQFGLFPNHAFVLNSLRALGFCILPGIIWRKTTNAPNKFMGSGTLPAGAYVTLEHEHILVVRKPGKRIFADSAKQDREKSSIFWEERNAWFSDIWNDVRGSSQGLAPNQTRERSGAFPFEIPCRLISMYSIYGDTVLDPFAGTGITSVAAAALSRSSIGYEREPGLKQSIEISLRQAPRISRNHLHTRLENHRHFIVERTGEGRSASYTSTFHGFQVVSRAERNIQLRVLARMERDRAGLSYRGHSEIYRHHG